MDNYFSSFNWFLQQLSKKKINLQEYAKKDNANSNYILREEAFIASAEKYMKETSKTVLFLEKEIENYNSLMLSRLDAENKFSSALWQICILHGIDVMKFINKGPEYLKYLLAKSYLEKAVRMPDAFQPHFPKSADNLFKK